MTRFFRWVLDNTVAVLGAVAGLVAAGLWALADVPFDAFPDLTGTRVEVIAVAPGFVPEEVEQLVTYPLEQSLMGLPGAEGVRSMSKYGIALITVPFKDGTDLYLARNLVQARLNDAAASLPAGTEATMGPIATPLGEVYQYTIRSDSMSLLELKALHDYVIRPRLRSVPGVSEVNSWGGLIAQVQVTVDPARLAARGLTIEDVHRALAENTMSFGNAYTERAGERTTLRGLGRVGSPAEVERVIVATRGAVAVRVGDVATVALGPAPRAGAVTRDGRGEVMSGMVLKLVGADSRAVMAGVRARMAEIRAALPRHVVVEPFYDQGDLIDRVTGTIARNLLEGGLLVVGILFLFLRDVRAALVVASVIPLSMLAAFLALRLTGGSANLMSLGAVDFGLLVDASVVMVDNFVRRMGTRNLAADRRATLVEAAAEVGRPILFGVGIIVAVYLPIFTLQGMEGRMFAPMAFTVVCAVLGSLLLAMTYVPAISRLALRPRVHGEVRWFARLQGWYDARLRRVLAAPRAVLAAAALLVVGAVGSLTVIGTEFMPRLDEGAILVNTRRLPGIALDEATRLSTMAERALRKFPEVTQVVTKEGRPDVATEAMGLYEGDLYVSLRPRDEWTTARDRDGLVAAFDTALRHIPGLWVSFTQPLAMRLDEAESGIKTDLGVKVVGPDLQENAAWAARIAATIARVEGAADVQVEVSEGANELRLQVDREALARYGLTVQAVRQALELAMGAQVAAELIEGPRRIAIAVRYPDASAQSVETLSQLQLRTPEGGRVPLGSVATLTLETAPELVGHEDAQRRTLVLSNVRGRDLGGFVGEVRARVARELRLPAGMFLEWGGQYENQQRALGRLVVVVPLALALIVLLLYFAFRDAWHAGLILTTVPFALVGGIASLWARGLNLSISSSIGIIALAGIAVLNGVVLVEHINLLRHRGSALDDAVTAGAEDRLRPVLMTALVAAVGFVPMALSQSAGAEVQRPLATVVIGGLVTATLGTLFVLPVLYRALERWRARRAARVEVTAPSVVLPAT
jgi:cobalt-zinc-cadmium resistance protein CzcA